MELRPHLTRAGVMRGACMVRMARRAVRAHANSLVCGAFGHDDRRYNRPDRLIDGYARHASILSDLPPGAHNDGVIGLSSHLRCCRHSMGGLKILEIP
jgi:hypothetical protein